MRRYEVGYSKESFLLFINDTPWYAIVVAKTVDKLCAVTRHVPCGAGVPEFFWNVPLGKRKVDPEDGYLINSLGSAMHDLYDRVYFWKENTSSVKISRETALAVNPEFVAEMDDFFGEDDKVKT